MEVFSDEIGKRNFKGEVNSGLELCRPIYMAWNKLPLEPIRTTDQLRGLISGDLSAFLVKMLPAQAEPVKLMGITLKPARIIELMDIDTTEVEQIREQLRGHSIGAFLSVATVEKAGLAIDKNKLDQELKKFGMYAVSKKQIEAAQACKAAVEAIQKLITLGLVNANYFLNREGKDWIKYNGVNGDQLDVHPRFMGQILNEAGK